MLRVFARTINRKPLNSMLLPMKKAFYALTVFLLMGVSAPASASAPSSCNNMNDPCCRAQKANEQARAREDELTDWAKQKSEQAADRARQCVDRVLQVVQEIKMPTLPFDPTPLLMNRLKSYVNAQVDRAMSFCPVNPGTMPGALPPIPGLPELPGDPGDPGTTPITTPPIAPPGGGPGDVRPPDFPDPRPRPPGGGGVIARTPPAQPPAPAAAPAPMSTWEQVSCRLRGGPNCPQSK
jgi:hypothetical protein